MSKSNKKEDLHGDHFVQARTILVALGADEESAIFRHSGVKPIKITGARWIPDTAITGAATNNPAVQIVNKGVLGTGTTGITAVKTYASGTNAVKFVAEELTLSTTAADLVVTTGEVVAFEKTENGTGLALPPGLVELSYEYN
jgi:predicted ThiF/HesA family dinucleotide-utilizing enzyme